MSAVANTQFIAPNNAKVMIRLITSIDAPMRLSQMKKKKNFSRIKTQEMVLQD